MAFILWLLLGLQTQQPPPSPPKATPPSWIVQLMKKLGIDPQIYSKLGGVRSPAGRSTGTLLLSLDLKTGREDVLLDGQAVWSPLMTSDGRVLVVRPDGVSALALTPDRQPPVRVNAWVPDVLLGTMSGESERVMGVVQSGTGATCLLNVATFRLDQAPSTSPVADSARACSEDPSDVLRNALRWRNRRVVRAAPAGGGRLQLTEVKEGQTWADVYFQDVAIRFPADAVISRSDPVWVDQDRIVYVGSR
jgi:hypothetical protein